MKKHSLLIPLCSLLLVLCSLLLLGHWQGTAANAQVQVPMFYDEHYLFPRPWTQFQAAPGVPQPAPVALHGDNRLSQPFTPGMDYLNLVSFVAQGEGQQLAVALRDNQDGRVWRQTVALNHDTPTAVRVAFDPIPNSAQRTFWLTLTAPEATPDNPVLLFTTGGDRLGGSLRLNEFPRPGNLLLRTYSAGAGSLSALREQFLPNLFGLRLQQYKVFKGEAFALFLVTTAVLTGLWLVLAHPAVLNGYKWRDFWRISGGGLVLVMGLFLSWQLLAGRMLLWPTAVYLIPSPDDIALSPPPDTERLIYDLSQQLWTAERVPDERFVATTPQGITVPSASSLRYSLPLPPASRLAGAVAGLPTPGTGLQPDTAVVRVNGTDIWTTTVRPSAAPVPFDLDLTAWAGQAIRLELVVLGEPTIADQRPAIVAWQSPQIVTAVPWLTADTGAPAAFAFAPPPASGQTGDIGLLGVALDQDVYVAGDTAVVDITWRTAVPTEAYGTLFIHLLDETGEIVAQVDDVAGPMGYPTAVWPTGAIVQDSYALQLPAELPPGAYSLALGLYDGGSGVRWVVAEGADDGHGRVVWPDTLNLEIR